VRAGARVPQQAAPAIYAQVLPHDAFVQLLPPLVDGMHACAGLEPCPALPCPADVMIWNGMHMHGTECSINVLLHSVVPRHGGHCRPSVGLLLIRTA
jgi:hypothetical protein